MAAPVRKYNPGFLTDDELVASFCIRTTEFEMLVEALRECTGPANQHQIVIGPRGSGKTTLLLRIAAEARRDPPLAARCFPIVFAEESYEVSTAGEFWLECLTLLAAQAPRRQDEPDLHRTAHDLRTIRDDSTLADRCLGALLDFADRHDQRLLLLVENLNMLFRDMTDRDAGWRLRKVLQTEPRIILFASATSRFREIDHPEHALYDLFRVRTLRPLDTSECEILWNVVAGRTPPTATIRSLEILTGGNPRLLAIVARFGAARSFRQLMADLFDLVDDHTEYFKSHLDSLAAQERRVYAALAALWKPATTREIAAQARLDTNICSAQLTRLCHHGAIQVTGGSPRRKQYYLTERLYNIYYLLRRHRGPDHLVKALIHFMESYYAPDELKEIAAHEIKLLADETDDRMRPIYQGALEGLLRSPVLAPYRNELDFLGPDQTGDADVDLKSIAQFLTKAHAEKRPQDTLETCDEIERRFRHSKDPYVSLAVAIAILMKGALLLVLNRPQDAVETLDGVIDRLRDSKVPGVVESIAAVQVCRGAALRMSGRPRDALSVLEQVAEPNESDMAAPAPDPVAMALVEKGTVLMALNRSEDALEIFEQIVERFGEGQTAIMHESVALALMNKGAVLKTLNRPEDARAAYDEVVTRFDRKEFTGSRVGVFVTEALLQRTTTAHAESDVQEVLSLFAKGTPLSSTSIRMLIELSVDIGPQRMNELIRQSPAAHLLLPLTTALDQELGNEPRVPEEVGEVAQDVRRQLEALQKGRD